MRVTRIIAPLALAAAIAAAPAAVAAPAAAAPVEYEGTVVSVDRDARTFRLRDSERGTIRIKVNRRTRYERVAGFRGLQAGMTNIEATVVRRSGGRWVAREVERSGGGGEHGGDDHRGSDDD